MSDPTEELEAEGEFELILPLGFMEEFYKTVSELFTVPPELMGEPVHIPWYRRLRYRFDDAREAFAARVYKLLAGHDLPESDW